MVPAVVVLLSWGVGDCGIIPLNNQVLTCCEFLYSPVFLIRVSFTFEYKQYSEIKVIYVCFLEDKICFDIYIFMILFQIATK